MFILVFGAFASAQMELPPMEVPKTEFFLGYSFQRADTTGSNVTDNTNLNGFAFEFSHYFHKSNLGFTIDVAHTSNSRVDSTGIKYSRTNYLAGPTYRLHNFRFLVPSVHVLAGVDHDNITIPETNTVLVYTDTDVAVAGGVTLDGNLSRHLAVRLAQVDYLYTHHNGTGQSSFRYSGGVVARF